MLRSLLYVVVGPSFRKCISYVNVSWPFHSQVISPKIAITVALSIPGGLLWNCCDPELLLDVFHDLGATYCLSDDTLNQYAVCRCTTKTMGWLEDRSFTLPSLPRTCGIRSSIKISNITVATSIAIMLLTAGVLRKVSKTVITAYGICCQNKTDIKMAKLWVSETSPSNDWPTTLAKRDLNLSRGIVARKNIFPNE